MAEVFETTEYKTKKARTLLQQKGLLAEPENNKGKCLSDNIVLLFQSFNLDDRFSICLPGAKDFVSMGNKEYIQTQLLLSNLCELYEAFKEEHPAVVQVGFSKFCSLRPKLCVIAGASGTHSICACSIHQNIKLLVDALPNNTSYKGLLKLTFCGDDKNREQIMRQCDQCPDDLELMAFLCELLQDFDDISFKQWQTTDKCTLMAHSAT